jgi:hypothetical protein
MKVDELRAKLFNLEKPEIIKLAVEFYKLVPKAKKEINDLDALINAPTDKPVKSKDTEGVRTLDTIEDEINTFIANAKEQYYLYPNKIVSNKERPKWRFKVKAWFKELTNPKTKDFNQIQQADVLTNLYNLLCESCRYQYFSADDTFQSIGIEQEDFLKSVLQLMEQVHGKIGLAHKGVGLVINNETGPNTFTSDLMIELINALELPDYKYEALDIVNEMLAQLMKPVVVDPKRRAISMDSIEEYRKKEKKNRLAELGFRLYASLSEYNAAIDFYKKHHFERDIEITLYILIRLLFELKQKDLIKSELEKAQEQGIKPRSALVNLLATIKSEDILPESMW